MMKSYNRSEIVSGIFVVLALGVFALFAFKVGQFDILRSLSGPALDCATDFRDVKSLSAMEDQNLKRVKRAKQLRDDAEKHPITRGFVQTFGASIDSITTEADS